MPASAPVRVNPPRFHREASGSAHGATPAVRDYCREARRLRKVYADQPARLHSSLRELSKRHDEGYRKQKGGGLIGAEGGHQVRVRRAAPKVPASLLDPSVSEQSMERFAAVVTSELEAGVLRYSRRLALLRAAERMGIGRFHANLIIAAAQHQSGSQPVPQLPQATSHFWRYAGMLVLLIQGAIVWGWWRLLHG